MPTVVEIATRAGAPDDQIEGRAQPANEDAAGAAGVLAWVIDGATDVVDRPLTGAATDARWAAETLDGILRDIAGAPPDDLVRLPAVMSERLEGEFDRVATRRPAGRHEHPSASVLVVRASGAGLEWVAVGDCTLLVETGMGVLRLGTEDKDAGDPWIASALTAFRASRGAATAAEGRAHVWPRITAARAAMNRPDGYGVLSITRTPDRFVKAGSVATGAAASALLASDGLMRIVDVFHRYTAAGLLAETGRRGVARLIAEVRAAECADRDCVRYPRAKVHDDATGVLIRCG